MRNVLLIIRADFGTYLAVPMALNLASELIDKHKRGNLPLVIGGTHPDGGGWSFVSNRITLLHTQELDQTNQPMQQGTVPTQFPKNLSGY